MSVFQTLICILTLFRLFCCLDVLQAEKEYDDYEKLMIDRKRGVKHHLLTGHGPTQETFEKRDFATTSDMVYGRRADVETIINPNTFEGDMGKTRSKQ